jgi:hypothetical protein
MPEYSQVQTYVRCHKDNFSEVLSQFSKVLIYLGFDENYIEENFCNLEWEVSDNGFMYVGSNTKSKSIEVKGCLLNIRPHVMGWTKEVITNLNESWLEISLLFETEELIESYDTLRYKTEVQTPLWHCMLTISNYFQEVGTYLTDEVTDGRPWEALVGDGDGYWNFDAAIIPKQILNYYTDVPRDFSTVKQGAVMYCMYREVWNCAPWEAKVVI